MSENKVLSGLEINADVIEKMVAMATLEVEGVAAMAKKAVDISEIMSSGSALKPVRVAVKNGAVDIDVFVCVKAQVKVKDVAEEIQKNVKARVQDMTGNAITRVNVHIADVCEETEEQ